MQAQFFRPAGDAERCELSPSSSLGYAFEKGELCVAAQALNLSSREAKAGGAL